MHAATAGAAQSLPPVSGPPAVATAVTDTRSALPTSTPSRTGRRRARQQSPPPKAALPARHRRQVRLRYIRRHGQAEPPVHSYSHPHRPLVHAVATAAVDGCVARLPTSSTAGRDEPWVCVECAAGSKKVRRWCAGERRRHSSVHAASTAGANGSVALLTAGARAAGQSAQSPRLPTQPHPRHPRRRDRATARRP